MTEPSRLVVAITGASGAQYGIHALTALRAFPDVETHLVMTRSARAVITAETGLSPADVADLADVRYSDNDLGATIASGSFRTDGMLVAPCSIKTLSGIANCYDDSLVIRAADVMLKERRRLVLLVRETPLRARHLELMSALTREGAVIMPPVPAFYPRPESVEDIVAHTVGRALDLFGIETGIPRWTGRPDG
ncbi:UbiX family flavin prenyltransferase [Amycolatopsis pithecellobii]|uniref:UbiX family flavin prenyltransferase n=1 Tax=Amycolatopsis pithecellobii TaxID=664692 RepID=UPI001FE8E283|nr:UbiX family flavin prenyltransferase [Amycolatopsis pithecellobii]